MNDNINYDDDVFENEEQENEELDAAKDKGRNFIRIGIGAIVVFAVVIVVLVSVLLNLTRNSNEETTLDDETTTLPLEITTSPEERYEPGQYTVNVGGTGTLNIRKEPSKDSEQLISAPHGALLNITEIKYDAEGDDKTQFWGKTEYLGWEGWVSMNYLMKTYPGGIVTPGEQTTAEPEAEGTTSSDETTAAPEVTTAAPEATTAAPEVTTAAPENTTSSGASTAYATGKYTVDAQPHLNMREDHNVSALAIAQIPDKSEVTVVEVYYDENSSDSYTKYWGKVTFGGITGWVAMGYLE